MDLRYTWLEKGLTTLFSGLGTRERDLGPGDRIVLSLGKQVRARSESTLGVQ